ncbi:hypothetical protein [Puia sp.]|jgi:hypothetical protein|uniref:hypothetical protein n=1 Tax=Puia sp. TaxID=2045100 RepID=UPI002F41E649
MLVNWIDLVAKVMAGLGGLGFFIAAFSYRQQVRIRQAEWLKSLFEKFFENTTYKEVRSWLDYGVLHERLNVGDPVVQRQNEEKFTDFLNFFEFIGVLHFRGHLPLEQVWDVFDYYLGKIGTDMDCREWIDKYGFEKLKGLLARA